MTAPTPPPGRRRTWHVLLAVFVTAAALAGSAVVWWTGWPAPEIPLAPEWVATTRVVAGDGVSGTTDGVAGRARFVEPYGLVPDRDGALIVSDGGAHRLRRIAPDGTVSTFAGWERGYLDALGTLARFDTPSGIARGGDGTLYVADTGNNVIRRIGADGAVSTLAGDGVPGFRDGAGRTARFNGPVGVAVDAMGRIVVADTYNDRIRIIAVDGTVTTVAGDGVPGLLDGPSAAARFDTPTGVALDGTGQIVVADTGNDRLRIIDTSGSVGTLPLTLSDPLLRPAAVAGDANGTLYVTDDRGRVIEHGSRGTRVLAGSVSGYHAGDGMSARFRQPAGIAITGPGQLVVADSGNGLVRLVLAQPTTRPPDSPLINPRFDITAFASAALLWPVEPLEGPHEIAGTIGEARGAGGERFHAGIDVRAEQGLVVRAVRPGTVRGVLSAGDFGSLNEWLRIGPLGYIHIRVGRDRAAAFADPRFVATYDDRGRISRVRVKRGAAFATGDAVGTVNPFNHVHVNVGWSGEEYNPLGIGLVQFSDGVPPTIARNGITLRDAFGARLQTRDQGRLVVSGSVSIIVDAWDQADGNRPNRRLGLYEIGYQVLTAQGVAVDGLDDTRVTLRFDRLSQAADTARLVYAEGSGIPFYGSRTTRFLYNATNTFRGGVARESRLDTSRLTPGDYILRIRAADVAGNEAIANRDLAIRVVSDAVPGR